MTHRRNATTFRDLHRSGSGGLLVLPNAWDAMSARLIEEAGAPAIATTSAGVSWSLGFPDGQGLTREQMLTMVRRITDAVQVPVTADIEGGYGRGTPEDVAETARAVIGAGGVGINLEDSPGHDGETLLDAGRQCERIAAARGAALAEGVDLFVNARIDTYLLEVGPEAERLVETMRRARAYVDAGADGFFVPDVIDPRTVAELVEAVDAPLNIMGGPGAPSVAELRRLGVRRVSLGPAVTKAVMMHIRRAAAEALGAGTYESLRDGIPFAEANGLFDRTA